jgi:hypothetical protein
MAFFLYSSSDISFKGFPPSINNFPFLINTFEMFSKECFSISGCLPSSAPTLTAIAMSNCFSLGSSSNFSIATCLYESMPVSISFCEPEIAC